MFSRHGFTLLETVVAVLIGALTVLAVGGLCERLIHHRTTSDSNSAAISLAERQMEALLADPTPNPTGGACPSANLCGAAPPSGLTHGPTSVDINGSAAASGPFSVRWVVVDAGTGSSSPLVLPAGTTSVVKVITVTVTHLQNPSVGASVVRSYQVS